METRGVPRGRNSCVARPVTEFGSLDAITIMQQPPPLPKANAQTPPPLPPPLPPRLDGAVRPEKPHAATNDYTELRHRVLYFVPVILTGVPVGLLPQAWAGTRSSESDTQLYFLALAAIGCIGLLVIAALTVYFARRSEIRSYGGLRRSYWIMGLPSFWLLGVWLGYAWKDL